MTKQEGNMRKSARLQYQYVEPGLNMIRQSNRDRAIYDRVRHLTEMKGAQLLPLPPEHPNWREAFICRQQVNELCKRYNEGERF